MKPSNSFSQNWLVSIHLKVNISSANVQNKIISSFWHVSNTCYVIWHGSPDYRTQGYLGQYENVFQAYQREGTEKVYRLTLQCKSKYFPVKDSVVEENLFNGQVKRSLFSPLSTTHLWFCLRFLLVVDLSVEWQSETQTENAHIYNILGWTIDPMVHQTSFNKCT